MLVLDIVKKLLKSSKSFSIIFILNFALAIASLSYLQFFKASIDNSLDSEAKSLLGADLVITSRFAISDEQIEDIKSKLPPIKNYHQGLSTVSMVSSANRARLMELVKIEEGYPYYGGMTFRDNSSFPNPNLKPKDDEIWIYKEVIELLDVKIGESLKIGKHNYTISKIIEDDTLKAVSFSGFMPKIYMSKAALERSELLQFGSTARYKVNFLLQDKLNNDTLEKLEDTLENSLDKNLRVLSPNDGRDRLLNVLNFITNFLSLVSLISFFLGLVGLIYLYSGFLEKHKNDIDVLNDIGMSKKDIAYSYLGHLFSLVFIASVIVFTLIFFLARYIAPTVGELIGFDFEFAFDYWFFVQSIAALFIVTLSIGIPLLLPLLNKTKPSVFKMFIWFIPFIISLVLIAHSVSTQKNIGLFFAFGVIVVIGVLFGLGKLILKGVDFTGHLRSLSLSLAIKNITRQNTTSITLFSAILLCTTFFTLIPQVGSSLSQLLTKSVDERPRFFVVDAKEDKLEALKAEVKSLGANVENISPMIRGRVIKINDIDFSEHAIKNKDKKEKIDENELKNRAVNLSYRNSVKNSESIVEGREFSGPYDSLDFSKPIELSVEKRYAIRRGIKLGDSITFDVLGMELQTVVVNIRTVKWLEFTPNFFFIMQEGVLDDAPKTILATITHGNYDASKFLISLTDAFPSLTVIDVKNLFETFSKLVSSVTLITDRMSFYSIVIGLIMSFIIIRYQLNLQQNNIMRLKMIGVDNTTIKNSLLLEFGIITFGASFLGIILGSVASFFVSDILFESYWDMRIEVLATYFLAIPLLTIFIVYIFSNKIIKQKENVLFGE